MHNRLGSRWILHLTGLPLLYLRQRLFNHPGAIIESDHVYVLTSFRLSDAFVDYKNLARITDPHNSSLDNVVLVLTGATLVFDEISVIYKPNTEAQKSSTSNLPTRLLDSLCYISEFQNFRSSHPCYKI